MIDIAGEYGIKIRNIEASTLLEYNLGVRDHYEFKNAMLVNSLFLDFLKENGMKIHNGESTRDIICFEFTYGTRSYQKEMNHLRRIASNASEEYKDAQAKKDENLIQKALDKRNKISELTEKATKNKDLYIEKTKYECRLELYTKGASITYTDTKGNSETIHYKMLFRSTGKAKKGSCMFIRDELYDIAHDFLYMGIQLPEENAPIVEISAYAPLVSSGIVGKVRIEPENILILKDVDSYFKRDIVSIEIDKNKNCIANRIDDYELKNTMFDGQALIDASIFPDWASGYVLLRHHMTKMAAFHTDIQLFFKDWCKENEKDYETYKVTDIFGIEHYVKDIKLITTDNAIKWAKFSDYLGGSLKSAYEYWCKWVHKNDCQFGVVKFSHPSKLGQYQRMSYQHVNSLDEATIDKVCQTTIDYIDNMKDSDEVFKLFLKRNQNFSNDYEVLLSLLDWNPEFALCSYYRERKREILKTYLQKAKAGQLLQEGDNLTIVGSPYAMLLYAISGDPKACELDNTLLHEDGTIQCYTSRFKDGEYLAGFRSPFNGRFNMDYLHNHYDIRFNKYFIFSDQIVVINMLHTDAQDRNNGSDQDSDFIYATNQPDIVAHAKMCYEKYPTIVNNIPKDTNKYKNTLEDYAKMDDLLAGSQRDIGESSNLAQLCQTYSASFGDSIYDDYVAILSVIAQASIDSSKRRFAIDIPGEILRIKKNIDIEKNGYPIFWKAIKKEMSSEKINKNLHCPMDYLQDMKTKHAKPPRVCISLNDFLEEPDGKASYRGCRNVEAIISQYTLDRYLSAISDRASSNEYDTEWDSWILLRSDFQEMIKQIREATLSKNYKDIVIKLIKRTFLLEPKILGHKKYLDERLRKNKSLFLKALYDSNPSMFLSCFRRKLP